MIIGSTTIKIRLILKDQLSHQISSLNDITQDDLIFMCESIDDFTDIKHHPKKIAFILATMRHFALELQQQGFRVHYIKLDDENNSQSLISELEKIRLAYTVTTMVVTEPSEYKYMEKIKSYQKLNIVNIDILPDNRFLSSIREFNQWTNGKKQLRMEYFYREMRKKYNILVNNDGTPVGGIWNYDKENRNPPSKNLTSPSRIAHKKSAILKEVLQLVATNFADHFGDLLPFNYAINKTQALIEFDHFINNILQNFGNYQDAMVMSEVYLNHSLLSSYINIGLLLPLEICKKVEQSYYKGLVSLNCAEGFIRQILGWREYIRGIYWLKMPQYANLNYFEAKIPLPQLYWGGKTDMSCMAEVIKQTKEHSYSHHIQRLMITGNFALIAGLDVQQVHEWYLSVYSDAYEWVEMPNTIGMALFADGGIVASKPYAASGNYINKMSNFCQNCKYKVKEVITEDACPFNSLYWYFMLRNYDKLKNNNRLSYVYSTWSKFNDEKQQSIINKALNLLDKLTKGVI